MSAVVRCERTDLLPDQCSCPQHRGEPERVPHPGEPVIRPDSPSFHARFPGWCVECREPIYVGDLILNGSGGYAHEECLP